MSFRDFILNLPEVQGPTERKLNFNEKLKWTLIILISFFVLAEIPLFGLASNALQRFEYLAIILGTKFGSIISLGIGPIVTASIVLQLLVGSGLLSIDLTTPEGKKYFQGLQKLLTLFFTFFEAAIYVLMKGLEALPGLEWILIFQLFIGGILIMFMDDVVSKWGFGSGVSIFIVAGVSLELFTRAFGFIGPQGQIAPVGKVLVLFTSLMEGNTVGFALAVTAIIATIIVFLLAVYGQSMKVEIPLSLGRIRGFGIRWPLSFFYTSNIPVILTAALLANVQLFGRLIESWAGHATWLGGFSNGQAVSGLAAWLSSPPLLESIISGSFKNAFIWQSLIYVLFMIGGSIMFAIFWVKTSGMDSSAQAKQIMASGFQIPGFRRDERILESILDRYIMPLTVMGGAAVGLLAASADLLGALVRGTGLLLSVMIIYKLYQDIAQQHAMDMNPTMRKLMMGE